MDELIELARDALAEAIVKIADFRAWHERLREVEMPEPHWKVFAYNLLERRAVAPSEFPKLIEMRKEEIDDGSGETVYAAHGAVTRLNRGKSMFAQEERNKRLNQVVNDYLQAVNF